MHFLSTFSVALACVASTIAATPAIVKPVEGTHIAPGAAFDFDYDSIADYGASSYNYSVWLLTSLPASLAPSTDWASGHFFGRFAEPNYPGNPNPSNTPPAQLIMPDFSKNPGGFGSGASASNVTCYIAVLEEYANGEGTLGYKLSFTANKIVYNATSHAA